MFAKGAKIEITTEAHAYGFRGITDQGCIIPKEIQTATVRRTRKTKNGIRVYFVDERGRGFGHDIGRVEHTTYRPVS